VGATDPVSALRGGRPPGGRPEHQARGPAAAPVRAVLLAACRAPFTGRARRELAFCILGLPFGVAIPVAGFAVTIWLALLASEPPWVARGNPSWWAVLAAGPSPRC
jgi:hypothetical protein